MIVAVACQAEYDQVAWDFYANDPAALKTLVEEHGVTLASSPTRSSAPPPRPPSAILEELRSSGRRPDPARHRGHIAALATLRSRTENMDVPFLAARQRHFTLS